MKRYALLGCLLMLLLPAVAAAQTPVAIEGLKVIAERQYAVETEGAIDTSGEGVFLASARVYLFEDAESADATWKTLIANESVEKDLPDDDSVVYEKTELDDVGDRAMALHIEATMDNGEQGTFRTVVTQRDAMIVTATVIAGSSEGAGKADEIATAMIKRDPSDTESKYDGLGTSTGGVWDVFLPADADELEGLTVYADKETRPAE